MAITTQIIQGEALTSLNTTGTTANVFRTQTANQEKHGLNGLGFPDDPSTTSDNNTGLPDYDDYGLRPDYTGDGYLDLNGGIGPKASFTFDAPAGTYAVTVRVANGSTADRKIALSAGGVETASQATKTGQFYLWQERTFTVTVTGDGPHTVTILQKDSLGPNIDAVAVHEVGTAVSFDAPAFTSPTEFTVSENAVEVGQVAAEDVEGDPMAYAIAEGGDGALFEIDAATGALRFKAAPDFEAPGSAAGTNTYSVTVTATDGVDTTEQVVTVAVTDDTSETLARPVIEPQVVQAEAGTITLATSDATPTFHRLNTDPTTAEAPGNDKILDASGLRVGYSGTGYTDFENDAGDTLTVPFTVAEDGVYSLHIRYASQLSGTAERTLDIAANPGTPDAFVLGGTTFPTTTNTFATGSAATGFNNWGVVTVEVALKAGENTIALSIPAGKTAGPNVDALALTTAGEAANFAAPAFASDATFAVDENASLVGTVQAADIDDDTTDGVASTVAYAIAGGADADAFTIDADTGVLSLVAAADFETKPSYEVIVSATDAEGAETTQTVTVTVTNVDETPTEQPPTGITLTRVAVVENVDGAVLADIAVNDPDTTYAASDLTVSDPATFRITGEPGALQLALQEGVSLDREAGAQPLVTVSLASDATVSAEFTPAPENDPSDDELPNTAPTAQDGTAETEEDTAVTVDVADLVADAEEADAVLVVTASSEQGTVEVLGTELTFTPEADFSGEATIAYTVTDTRGLAATADVTVSVAAVDDPATVALTPVAVEENAVGAVVASIAITDPDTSYAATDVTVSDNRFRVIEEDGALRLALAEGVALDFESEIPAVTVSVGRVTSEPFSPAVTDVSEGGPVPVVFDAGAISGYSTQDKPGQGGAGAVVAEEGSALTLDGNLWKRVALPQDYAVTENTRLELSLTVGAVVPEIVAVGFDADEDPFNGNQAIWQLGGTQNQASLIDLRGTGEAGRFVIDLSAHAGKTLSSLVFVADDDSATNGLGSATFADMVFVEADPGEQLNAAPRVVGGGVADFALPEGGAIEIDLPFVDDDGDALTYSFEVTDADGALVTIDGLSIADGVLSGAAPTAPGAYTITVRASDDEQAEASDSFTLTVQNVNEAPVADDPALEPVIGTAGQPIASIDLGDFAGFFTDPDGDALTLTVEDLPAGLSVNEEGVITGMPLGGGNVTAKVRATDPDGLSATVDLVFQIGGGGIGDAVVVEAESFTGLNNATNFYATAQTGASGERIIRAADTSGPSIVTTELAKNGVVEGWYRVSMARYDETDGSATFSLSVGDTVLAENAVFDAGGQQVYPGAPTGNAGQRGNLKTIEFDTPVYVTADATLTLSGRANGELLRTDKFTFTRVDAPNAAPSAPTLDTSTVAENAAGAVVGTLQATDPEETAISFSTADPRFEIVGGQLKLREAVALDFEAGDTVEVEVTATDASGASTTATLTLTVTDLAEAPLAPTLSGEPVAENAPGAVAGTLSAQSPDGKTVTFTTDDARFEVVGGQLKLRETVSLDFEEAGTVTVSVTADDGASQTTGDVVVVVTDGNDAPTLAEGATVEDVSVAAGAGATIDLAGLGAADQDAGATLTLVAQGADGATLPEGFSVVGTDLVVPADAPAGAYEVEVFATDGEAQSESVRFTVTVGAPAPFSPFAVQAEAGAITLAQAPDLNSTQVRDADNPESNPDLPTGLRPDFSGTGYVDFGNDAGDTLTFTITVPAAGEYDLNVRYATNTARPLDLLVNGAKAAVPLPFASTDPDGSGAEEGFDHWAFQTRTIALQAGENTVALAMPAGTVLGPNLDRIEITEAATGPIPAPDTSADEDGNLFLDGPDGALTPTQAASINFNVAGRDADIVKVELSFDGGATRTTVTPDADGDFVFDGSTLPAGPATATVIVTDEAGNEAESAASLTIGTAEPVGAVVIQAEDETQVAVLDEGTGNTDTSLTREVNATTPDAFGNFRTGAVGDAYVDFGTNVGDAIAFTVNAPEAGVYTATVRYANGGTADRPLALSVNGAAAQSVPFSPTGTGDAGWENWTELTVEVTLVAGSNTVQLAIPAAAEGGVANGPNIDQIAFAPKDDTGGGEQPGAAQTFVEVVKINFEPGTVGGQFGVPTGYATPTGFRADTGEAFGARGDGFTYGWVDVEGGAVTATAKAQPTGSMRYKNDVPSASDLQKTYAHFEYPGAPTADNERAWEMALEDGTYEVTLSIGDTGGPYDSRYVINVEGEAFGPAWTPVNLDGQSPTGSSYTSAQDGEGFRSHLVTGVVQVTDGRLTIDSIGGQNTEIQWLDVERIPDLTPDDGKTADQDYSKFVAPVAASLEDGQVSIAIGPNGELPTGIDPSSSLVVGVQLQAANHRGPNLSYVDGVKLVETLTGQEVPVNVQITGGADSLTIRPLSPLKENTSYTLEVEDVLDLGAIGDSTQPLRQFQDLSTTFVTGEAKEDVARDVAFTESVQINGAADGQYAYSSIEFGPDGKLYVATITGDIHRWTVNTDGTLDKSSQETLSLAYFKDGGRGIIGLTFDPENPDAIWVTDNAPIPREDKAFSSPEFSGRVSKITLGTGMSFEGASAETYLKGLPRSGGDHLTNSLEFRANPDAGGPDYLLYLTQGSNSAAGSPDSAWGNRPERLLNAAVLEIDRSRDAPAGGFDVQTEPLPSGPTSRAATGFNDNGTYPGFYDPYAADAVLKIYATGVRNAYDMVWHSNGHLYAPTNGTASGGVTPEDPTQVGTQMVTNAPKQFDYLFTVEEGGYYGHPNPLHGEYILNGGNPTAGADINEVTDGKDGNPATNGYDVGVQPDTGYDIDGTYSLGYNQSPNGAIEYKGGAFGPSLKGALLFAQFSTGDNVRVIQVGADGRITGDDVLRRPDGSVIDTYIDPLDIIENPITGQLYLMTLNRDTGESKVVLLTPAPGGVAGDSTANEGGDLAISAVDTTDAAAVVFQVVGLDADIEAITVSFDGGQTTQAVTLDAQGRFTADLSGRTGAVTATLTVRDDAGNTASKAAAFSLGGGSGEPGETVVIDATEFNVLSQLTGTAATLIRRLDDPTTHETNTTHDANGDGLNDGYDGEGYLDPNGGAEDKASFTVTVAEAGTYSLVFRMANGGNVNGSPSPRPIAVELGDQVVTIANTHTGGFTTWQDFPVTLTLQAGANTVVIAQTTDGGAPNIDSVSITPLETADTTADAGGDLALAAVDATDPSAAVFAVSGLDADIETLSVSLDGGATSQSVTLDAQGRFVLDLGADAGDVTVTLTVTDAAGNTAAAASTVTVDGPAAPNDGEAVIGGVPYVLYEAENASLGGAVVVSETADDRDASGTGFVDFVGTVDQTVTWAVAAAEDGAYALDILYALASTKAARPMTLSVDGEAVATLPFAPNSNAAETVWGPQPATVTLAAGVHTISVTAPDGVGPNIDLLRITKGTVEVFNPTYAEIAGETRLEVEATDGTTRTVNDTEVEFYVEPVEGGVYALDLAANAGAPDGVRVTVLLDGVAVASDDFPEGGEETVYLTLEAGAQHKITLRSDAPGASSLDYVDLRPAPGNANADIAVESLDPTFLSDRLHFSFLQNPSATNPDRSFKDSAQVTISNTGTELLEFRDAAIDGPFKLADPDAFEGLTLAAGASVTVTVLFDGASVSPKPSNGQNSVYDGTLRLSTNDADTPVATVDLAGFWQQQDESGWEPNVNEVWELFGFGNRIEGLALTGGGENSTLSTNDVFGQTDETEVLSPYWKIADGVSEARITQIAAFHGDGGATLGLHGPGNKDNGNDDILWNHQGTHNQRILPLVGSNGGDGGVGAPSGGFSTATFTAANIPGGWAGNGLFGIEVAGLSTDPRLNPTGDVIVPGAQQGHTVKVFQAVDADGQAIANTYLVAMDYTGINYDYNDNLFVVEGVAPVGFGEGLSLSGLDDAAADERLVFTNINNPANASQTFRNEATITLTNDGVGPLTVGGVTVGGADAGSFQIVGSVPTTIASGASAEVTVRYVGVDPADDNAAVLHEAALTVETSAGTREVALAGLAQLQSEGGEEPTVAQIVEALGYATNMAQGQLANGGQVETIGDEVLLPHLERLDASQPVEVIQLAAFLNQGNVARLSSHELDSASLTELFAADDNQGQTILPDGLVTGAGDTGGVARTAFSPDGPFGLKVTVDGRPTYASWTDPEINRIDPDFGQLVGDDQGHLIRFFQAKDAAGNVIEGTYIGIQDYPGAGNYDYNDHMFLVRNVKAHALTAAEDADADGVVDALETDADGDGTAAFFDADDTPDVQAAFNAGGTAWAVDEDGLTLKASLFDTGGQGVAYNDDGTKSGDQAVRPGENVDISNGTGAVGYTAAGEWLEYTINVAEAGEHTLSFNASTPTTGRALTASFAKDGGVYETATAAVPNTGAYTSYADTAPITVTLEAGVQVLRVNFDLNQQDLMSFTLKPVVAPTNAAPVAETIGGVPAGTEDAPFSFDVSDFFSDPDGDALSYTLAGAPVGLSISPSGVITGTPTDDGIFTITVTASDGSLTASAPFTLSVAAAPVAPGQAPFPGPDAPAFQNGALTMDASNYDAGGQGVAYNDQAGLQGGSNGGRAGSDVEQTGAGDIGWIAQGEWLEYTIDVPQAGLYDLDLLLALGGGTGRSAAVTFTAAGASQPYASTGPIANPSTGSYANFQTRSADGIQLQAGEQVVRVTFAGGAQDFRSFTLTQQAPANQAPVAGTLAGAAADENDPFTLDVSGAFSDPDGDALAFSAEGLPQGLGISASGIISGTPTADGTYAVTVTASDGDLSATSSFTLTVAAEPPAAPAQTPFPGPNAPGFTGGTLTLAAPAYDQGGQGVAYNDIPGLQGGTTGGRTGSDVEVTGGGAVGWIEPGEWLEYTVSVPKAGLYDVDLLLATPLAGRSASVDVYLPGAATPYESSGSIANPSSGSYTNFQPRSAEGLALQAGVQVVRVTFAGGSQDFQGLTLTEQLTGPAQTPFPGPDAPVLADSLTVLAKNFDAGGQGVSWNDDAGLDSGSQAQRGDTDVELVGTAFDIGYVEKGEWVEYTIDVAEAGTYDLSVLAKSPIGGNSIAVSLDGGAALAAFSLADSNGSSTGFGGTIFGSTAAQTIALEAGLQTLRFAFDGTPASNGYLLDMRSFTLEAAEAGAQAATLAAPAALLSDAPAPSAIGEAGVVTVTQGSKDQWVSVRFAEALENPAVVLGPLSSGDADPATVRVRNVTSEGFEFQLDEWSHLDGVHGAETVSWMAVESGVHSVGGLKLAAGVSEASQGASAIGFGTSFGAAPVVTAQVTSANDPDAVTDRVSGVTATGFKVALDDEEANTSVHGTESLAWIAMSPGGSASSGLLAAKTGDKVTQKAVTHDFGGSFGDEFAFLADMQTEDGNDPATVRLKGLTASQATLFVEEEQSKDLEVNHTTEDVGLIGIKAGLIFADDLLS